MNKQKDRRTPFQGKYKMPVDAFCEKYGLDLKLVMHRMNVLFWEDFDSLVIPMALKDTSIWQVKRALNMLDSKGCNTDAFIVKRLDLENDEILNAIKNLSEYEKEMFRNTKSDFFLDPSKIDISKIFKEKGALPG